MKLVKLFLVLGKIRLYGVIEVIFSRNSLSWRWINYLGEWVIVGLDILNGLYI